MTGRRIVHLGVAAAAILTAGCAQRTDLEPLPGNTLPPAAYGEAKRPTVEELLERSPQAAPERNVELRTQSEPREPDPFDLPPER
ncbi:hypothetical protein [uncultured Croceicoccus sp.]|uniref:hypothetical protein n=1 Tax=uncultured Croceicoccus sp. TaxID=1295329 RepID=UPI00263A0002|nr:hypothetical protein [uncultured Croceicoccus sp.]